MTAKRSNKRAGAGRKDAHLNIRLTSEHRAIFGAAAEKAGISTSSWVILVALQAAKTSVPPHT